MRLADKQCGREYLRVPFRLRFGENGLMSRTPSYVPPTPAPAMGQVGVINAKPK